MSEQDAPGQREPLSGADSPGPRAGSPGHASPGPAAVRRAAFVVFAGVFPYSHDAPLSAHFSLLTPVGKAWICCLPFSPKPFDQSLRATQLMDGLALIISNRAIQVINKDCGFFKKKFLNTNALNVGRPERHPAGGVWRLEQKDMRDHVHVSERFPEQSSKDAEVSG